MKDIIRKGYARRYQKIKSPWKENYGTSRIKIRVVCKRSAKFHGTSLNKQLIQGPDLTSTLIGVPTRFRQKPIAFAANIELMFYQVPDYQRDLLRFLWWPGGDLTKNVEDYEICPFVWSSLFP